MREIVFDTETTGLDPQEERIVEIGAVELVDHMPTGRIYQEYINPHKQMDEEVIKVHGITNEFLADKPCFREVAQSFLDFIGEDSFLVAHNAKFDINFLNAEFERVHRPLLEMDRVIDTLEIARKKFPRGHISLDALCKKFNVDASARVVHGALLDAQLLSEVYLELLGGKEPVFTLQTKEAVKVKENYVFEAKNPFKVVRATEEECAAHQEFLKKLKNPFWLQTDEDPEKQD